MDVTKTTQTVIDIGIQVGFRVVGAIIFYLVGRWLISFAIRLVSTALERQKVDPTLLRYIGTVISVTLNIILVIAILGYFGVETTSFAAILAAAGVAIGMAWSGALLRTTRLKPRRKRPYLNSCTRRWQRNGRYATSISPKNSSKTCAATGF